MDTWFSKQLGNGVDAHAPSIAIQEAFLPMFARAGNPTDMAVFSRYDLRENTVTVYFSPAASQLAQTFGAAPCEKPSFENLSLLVGDQRSIDSLFPKM